MGLLLTVVVYAANVSEQAGARQIMEKVATAKAAGTAFFNRLWLLWVDTGYQAGKDFCAWVKALLGWRVEVIKRPEVNAQKKAGFILLPRRWVVERTFAWAENYSETVELNGNRRETRRKCRELGQRAAFYCSSIGMEGGKTDVFRLTQQSLRSSRFSRQRGAWLLADYRPGH